VLKNFLKRGLKKNSLELSEKSGDYKEHLYALILAGGGGTRLWPLSRNATPKQFLKLFGDETLTQITINRFSQILPWDRIFVVTVSEAYKNEIIREVPNIPKENIITEPGRRDTAPAHGIGAAYIYKKDPDAVIMTESADRLVTPVSRYLTILKSAAKISYNERILVALGVEARYPNTGYGYIKRGKLRKKVKSVSFYELDKFIEKPTLEYAKKYAASNNYFWNAGQYVWRADSILEAIYKYAPAVGTRLSKIQNALGTRHEDKVVKSQYKKMPKISIDYAVAEKARDLIVVEGDFHWTDIGDWKEVWENRKKDAQGNVIIKGSGKDGRVMNIDTSDALIHTDGRLIAMIDVDNVIVIDTEDVLLVASKSRAQNVKKIVEELKKESRKDLL
jgi:mannose-1-phosphate guanylyltransferase